MEKITSENCLILLKEKFPQFLPYCESYVNYWGIDQGITTQMMPFAEYVIDIIQSKDEAKIKEIFDYVEFLICDGNDSVQNAITTSFLELLLSKDPDEIQFTTFAKYLGKNSIEYCKAWDEFTGIKTKGLWED
ncbi:MAG: hypothetical protein K1000chlam3_00367 [Chlamydiae bacterium]|nr:hypothetical protein [Chlamydiota bacterium]